MSDPTLFDDNITLDVETLDDLAPIGQPSRQSHRRLVVGLAAAAVLVTVWLAIGNHSSTRGVMTLCGKDVAQLRPGAKVMLDGISVGAVERVEARHGLPAARLRIDPIVLEQIPGSSRFEVRSLNRFLPGNVGVRIVPPGLLADEPTPASDPIAHRERLADGSILPPRIPIGSHSVLLAIVATGILLGGLVAKVLKSIPFCALAGVVLIVVLYAWRAGELDDTARWAHERLKALQSTVAPIADEREVK